MTNTKGGEEHIIANSKLKCLLLGPSKHGFEAVKNALSLASKEAGFELVTAKEGWLVTGESVFSEIATADLIAASTSDNNPRVFYEAGAAHAAGKPVVFLVDEDQPLFLPVNNGPVIVYQQSKKGLLELQQRFRKSLEQFRASPQHSSLLPTFTQVSRPIIEFDRLLPREFENLCFELLTQMGFRRLKWGKEIKQIDAIATLPKTDPDGFQYEELWLISMGKHPPARLLWDFATSPDYFFRRFLDPRLGDRLQSSFRLGLPITFLAIEAAELLPSERADLERSLERAHSDRGYSTRIRFWDRQQLTNLLYQYPQIVSKYFSEEGRAQSRYRKSPEEFYKETLQLNESLRAANTALNQEREKRVLAERDAVWKEVAFTAAHKLGNPIFALETDLEALKRRIPDKPEDALSVAQEMGASIEKSKAIIEQFKSLTRIQEISPRPVDIVPLLANSLRVAEQNGIDVTITVAPKHPHALADPVRITECFDELLANSLKWFDKASKKLNVSVDLARKKDLPINLDKTKRYVRIRFEDNGCGIPIDQKQQVFSPFVTTHPHGTGLGLSLIQRVLETHKGGIRETGNPGDGAVFEMFIPAATKRDQT